MRTIAASSLFVGGVALYGQWAPLSLPVYNGMADVTDRSTVMVAPGSGFHAKSLFFSASSGGIYMVYGTVDDWVQNEELGGEGWPMTPEVRELTPASETSAFYLAWYFGPTSVCYVDNNGVYSEGAMNYDIRGSLSAVDDTVCFWMTGNEGPSWDTIHVMRSYAHNAIGQEMGHVAVPAAGKPIIAFRDQIRGVIAVEDTTGSTRFYITNDGGSEWDLRMTAPSTVVHAIDFLEDNTIWAVGGAGVTFRSTDGGDTWGLVDIGTVADIWSVSGYSPDSVWISGSDGVIRATGNAGITWTDHPIPGGTITKIQTFDGAVYAHLTTGSLFRYDPTVQINENIGEQGECWMPVANGIALQLRTGERLTGFQLLDAAGRHVNVPFAGAIYDMRQLATGLYAAKFSSSHRQANWKFYWPGMK